MIKQGTLAYKAIATPGLALLQTTEFVIRKVDGNDCFHDPARFPWVRDIESQWQTIRSEFNELLPQTIPAAQQISEEQARITTGHQWKTYVFSAFGRKATENCARCPETTRLVEQIPGMVSAMFSVLALHAHIRHHRGVFKGVLRYHLALTVPQRSSLSAIRVGDEVKHWSYARPKSATTSSSGRIASAPIVVIAKGSLRSFAPVLDPTQDGQGARPDHPAVGAGAGDRGH